MTWNLTNSCLDGETTEVRFFDVTNLLVWPAILANVYVLPQGAMVSQTLACTTGAKICFGADQPVHGLYWGLDIDGSKSCTSCCFTCATSTFDPGPLVCQ